MWVRLPILSGLGATKIPHLSYMGPGHASVTLESSVMDSDAKQCVGKGERMSEDTTKAEGGLTRREMLKKSALVGAVAWTVPIVGSFNAPAFGSHGGGHEVSPASCTHWNCGETQDTCGEGSGSSTCLCTTDNDPAGSTGGAFCVDGATPCPGLPDCTSSADCAPGWGCLYGTCCVRNVCAPPCGTPANSATEGASEGAEGPTIASL